MRITGIVVVAAATAFLTPLASAAQRGVTGTEIIIGQHSTLSGPVAPWGIGAANGIRMRFNEVNADGGINGRTVRFIVEDNAYQAAMAVRAADKLITRDRIFAMLGGLGTPMNNAVLERQLAANVPNLFPFSSSRSMTEPFHRLKFAGSATYYDQMRAGVKFFVDRKAKKKICSMYQNSDFGRDVQSGVDAQMKAMGLTLASVTTHDATDTDFSGAMIKHQAAGCDLITLGAIIRGAILPMATVKKMGWQVDFLTSIASFSKIVAEAKGGVTDGLHAMTFFEYPYPDTSESDRHWIQAYKEKFKVDYNQASVIGYMIADLTVVALDRAGRDLTTETFVKAIEGIKGYRGRFGGPMFSFSETRHRGSNSAFIAVVKDGRWSKLTDALSY
jgi:branched-chain amino acid transport system substrate-binding protein